MTKIKELKALTILKEISKNEPDTRKQRNNVDINLTIHDFSNIKEAIKELHDLNMNRNELQELFIKQELKHKKQIKELKIKFIEDIAFLKTGMNEKEMK